MKFVALTTAFVVLTFASLVVNTSAEGKIAREVKTIDAYSKTVDEIRERMKKPSSIFADTSDVNGEPEKWQSFPTERALEKHRTTADAYTIAYNWLSRGKIVSSNFTLSSPSGDWVRYNFHYFRPDGTLALVKSDYRTFLGDVRLLRRRYFNASGTQISQSDKILDLKTQRPKRTPGGVVGDDPAEVDYYLTTAKLPFAGLLRGN